MTSCVQIFSTIQIYDEQMLVVIVLVFYTDTIRAQRPVCAWVHPHLFNV